MTAALHAEWTKLRTTRGTAWLLLAVVAVTVAVSAAAAASARCPAAGCGQDPGKISLTGVDLGQAAVAIVAVLAVSTEYSTGMIRTTLAAMPGRGTVLAAKAAVVSVLVLAAGALAAAGSLLTGWLILPGHGFTRAHGFAPLTLADGPVLRATAGSVLYLALIGLFSLGAAAAVRDSAVAIGLVLGVLYLLPIVAAVVSQRDRAASPAPGRADDLRAGYPGHHRPAQPAADPLAGPGRAGRLGSRRAAGRWPAAAAA